MIKSLFYSLILIVLFASCASKKDVYYFQDIDSTAAENSFKFLNIQPGDILDIQIKALNPESVLVFQRQATLGLQQQQVQNRAIDGYLVGEDGSINLPIVGPIDTTNKSTQALAQIIQEALKPYIHNPTVNIRLLNFRVSVLGEVNKPGTFTVLEERVSLPQALGLAGDLTINGDRNHLLLIRNEAGKKTNQVIDLTKTDFLQSPFYFLKQNDIIYVRPNSARVKSSGLVGNASTLVSILSLAVSLFIVITR
ncbi:ligand-binding protein [Formosa sp. Hel3_A1_48]|uniref:polysaccharide biosynthesis/export family protein n=1 Tax=Formosa sp. Hel3_A1_48 TaxID=1336795 RepID=UPI00084E22AB|nr:polysaccharide biosynthesis/export family protein [Formosa sp. Hel3_A1_48]AOR26761.1 ligand-binding protein [Formosa sp. Hel3_A1_48]